MLSTSSKSDLHVVLKPCAGFGAGTAVTCLKVYRTALTRAINRRIPVE